MRIDPPGFFIKEELVSRGWTQADLAYILEMKPAQLNTILSGKTSITANTAVLLGDAFDMAPQFFSNLQLQFDLSVASPADPAVKLRAIWQNKYPLREMIKRSWVDDVEPALLDAQMMRFFEVSRSEEIPFIGDEALPVGFAAKKTSYESSTPSQIAWLYRVRQLAKRLDVPNYSEDRLRNALADLTGMRSDPDDAPLIIRSIMDAGVRIVVVEALPNSKIDGVCTWIGDLPAVGITNRFDRFDNFWFVIRHELEHVLAEHGKETGSTAIDDDRTLKGENINCEEREANKAAAEFCVDKSLLDSLIARKGNFVSEKDILAFSKRLAIHPALVVGQYQHRTKKWTFLRKYLTQSVCGVRNSLITSFGGTPVIDGWGESTPARL